MRHTIFRYAITLFKMSTLPLMMIFIDATPLSRQIRCRRRRDCFFHISMPPIFQLDISAIFYFDCCRYYASAYACCRHSPPLPPRGYAELLLLRRHVTPGFADISELYMPPSATLMPPH
jgi:hypothetical protein